MENGDFAAARAALELILPDTEQLENTLAAFDELLDESDFSVREALFHCLPENARFAAPWDDNEALLNSLDQLADAWGEALMYGSHDPDGMFTACNTVELLVDAAAVECRAAGLTLWQWQDDDEEMVYGWFSRAGDVAHLQRLFARAEVEMTAMLETE